MTLHYLRSLVHPQRNEQADTRLGLALAFVAGAANAGGFLVVGQYTSHMSGIVSGIADDLALGRMWAVLAGLSAVLAFVSGAGLSAILINWARHRRLESEFALSLVLEAGLLLLFGAVGASQPGWQGIAFLVLLLCLMMGLQNATITKISRARIRTTHMTGIATDFGIELGKLCYRNSGKDGQPPVIADRSKLWLLGRMLGAFVLGGLAGALGFQHLGFVTTLPLALILLVLAAVPILDDIRPHVRHS